MSCPCSYCSTQTPREAHSGSVRSPFTLASSQGALQVSIHNSSVQPCRIRLKVNKQHTVLEFEGQTVTAELWTKTIEDDLVVEVYHENLLLGERAVPLRSCGFTGQVGSFDVPSDFYEEKIVVELALQYTPHPAGADVFHIYRQNSPHLDDSVLTLSGPQGILSSLQIVDGRGKHRANTWHYVDSFGSSQQLELQLAYKLPGKPKPQVWKDSIDLSALKKTAIRYFDVGPADRKLTLLLSPGLSVLQGSPKNGLRVTVPKEGNEFLQHIEASGLSFVVKSPVLSDDSLNGRDVTQSEVASAFENEDLTEVVVFQASTFTPDDKLIVTLRRPEQRGTDILAVGLVKLVEIPTLQYDSQCRCPVQVGESLLVLTLQLQRDDTAATASHRSLRPKAQSDLVYQSKVFFDVLDLMDYKLGRIRKKNSVLQVQVGKLKAKLEMQKRQLFDLEHAPARADFKSLLERSKKKPAETKPQTAEPDRSICVCGALNPQFKGYCAKCVQKLKSDYERVRAWFEPIDKRFGDYEKKLKMWNTRKYALENKLARLEEKLLLPFVVEETQDSVKAKELLQELSRLQTDIQMLSEESKTKFEEMDAEEEAALGVLQAQEEEISTSASELEELQHRNEAVKSDIDLTSQRVQEEQQFYEKHSKRAGRK